MALQRSAGLLVNIHYYSIRVTGQIHPHVDLNFCHLFIDFGLWKARFMFYTTLKKLSNLLLRLRLLDEGLELS